MLTNLNVASSTDSLCNNIFKELSGISNDGLACDVWTVFDIIFTSVSAFGVLLLIFVLCIRKKGILIATGIVLMIAEVLIILLFVL